jgi:hypothetical protein
MRATAVLKMPRRMSDKVFKANGILAKLQDNGYVIANWPSDIVSLADFETHVQEFTQAEVNTKMRTVGLVGIRDAALLVLMQDLKQIQSMVEILANQNPETAQTVIESAGYTMKTSNWHRPKQVNAAYNTQVAGTAKLTADGMRAHEWEMSKDQVNITSLPATPTAYTYVRNLTPGDVIYFRTRKMCTNKMQYNWSPWMKLIIGSGGRVAKGISSSGAAGSIAA